MKMACLLLVLMAGFSCSTAHLIHAPQRTSWRTGTDFYKTAFPYTWRQRDSLAWQEIQAGNLPPFLKRFVPVHVQAKGTSGRLIRATFFAAPDYLSIGTGHDWARINITPHLAQRVADTLDCFLPTRKMVDDIYHAAKIKLEPVPMYAFRDSTPTMYQHHLIIEGQRKGRKGLIAGIQKDVVISGSLYRDARQDRVAIYGWHRLDGTPIQPLYTGHVYWWVDYSQGIRLIYRRIRVNHRWMDYREVLKDPVLRTLLCDEENCDFYAYPY